VSNAGEQKRRTSCIIVAICGSDTLALCIARIRDLDPPPGEIVVCAADGFEIPRNLEAAPDVKIVRVGDDSPVALAAAGIGACTGDVVCLTEDHCLPATHWIEELSAGLDDQTVVAAGGPIEPEKNGNTFDWAFFIVDFFRYVPPVRGGPVESLSVCNVAYRRDTLDTITGEWSPGFHETRVHDLLKRSGRLFLVPGAVVFSNRRVRIQDGVRERFTFGRLFAARRFRSGESGRRITFALGTVVLPALLFTRIAARCLAERRLAGRLVKASPHVVLLLLAWSLGELVGYVTGKPPSSAPAARNRSPLAGGQPANA
jgi:hypothetical protein